MSPTNGRVAVTPRSSAMSRNAGRRRVAGQGLQLVVRLAREEVLRVAIARDIGARDTHAPHLDRRPAVVGRVEPGRLARRDPPELLLAGRGLAVVVAIVADPQVASAGAVPVAEQHRERAPGRCEGERCGIAATSRIRAQQHVVLADLGRVVRRLVRVVPEGHGRQRVIGLPGGAEGGRPRRAAIEPERFVAALEPAVAGAPQQEVLAAPQDGEVDPPVAVDIDGVGARHRTEVDGGWRHRGEPQRRHRPDSRCDTGRPRRCRRPRRDRVARRRRSRGRRHRHRPGSPYRPHTHAGCPRPRSHRRIGAARSTPSRRP